ncbi:MAG: ADP-dependent glucokinase/phosphofructokinase [Alphaproteobacteria bacterium]|nr:ADP-dependent glucokinase/phosphofructokinase [Alphaproteobacteria bacterium]
MADLREIWRCAYENVPAQLVRVQEVRRAVTAFNTNIDAVVKISGKQLSELARTVDLRPEDLLQTETFLFTPKDVVRGIVKCFINGIAEEWLCEDGRVYEWMRDNLGYDRLQMGGQAGIVANVLAVLGVNEVCAHTNSLPKLQAEQFLDLPNLYAVDKNGAIGKAYSMDCAEDAPLIHQIIEFDCNDVFEFETKKYVCPKANRFIATYDTANIELKINNGFLKYIEKAGFDYMILSGFHNLTQARGGMARIEKIVPLVQQWKHNNPQGIIHLELASTQDKAIRKAVLHSIAPLVDSVGLNEREALDALEVTAPEMFAKLQNSTLTAPVLLDILYKLKEELQTPRIQLHFYGTYLTLQNKGFAVSPEANRRGMMLAATVAASKAGLGNIERSENLLWAHGKDIGDVAAENMRALSNVLNNPKFSENGIAEYTGADLIAVPTIIVNQPKTLVGMGDTISSVSLIGAR